MRAQNTALRSGSKLTETVMEALLDSRNCLEARYSHHTITHNVNRTIKPWTAFAVESFKKICRVNNSYGHGNESDKKLRYKKVLYLRQHKSVLDYKQKISPFLRKRLLFCRSLYATALDTLLFSIMDLVGKHRLENHILSIRMEHHCNWWDPKGSKSKGIFHHITWGSTKISYIWISYGFACLTLYSLAGYYYAMQLWYSDASDKFLREIESSTACSLESLWPIE